MKDSKFIELLNLYVDHQISPAEAEQLEVAVKGSPERRRVYREYCQMQKACAVLAVNFRTEAPARDPKIVEFQPRRSPRRAVAYVTSLAAVAACVAVVFTLRIKPATPVAAVVPTAAATLAVRPALQPVFGPKVLSLRAQNAELAESAADSPAFAGWMNNIQLSSMPGASPDDLRFDAHGTLQPDVRTYRAGRPIQGKVEWTAFTFQK
ncbi:MAG: hypothetical protein DUW69_000910 [Verrucomicrobia bacterium]|nr:MAG: hypothetical protein DUW69_000910 [Verrucomicrobiota bacterium]